MSGVEIKRGKEIALDKKDVVCDPAPIAESSEGDRLVDADAFGNIGESPASEQNVSLAPDQKEDDIECPQCIFHIVNSVKGGSGKSTIALLLAAYYANIKLSSAKISEDIDRDNVFIIDLDLHGSSWKYDYCNFEGRIVGEGFNFIASRAEDFKFINNWLYEKAEIIRSSDWPRLRIALGAQADQHYGDDESINKVCIPVFLANPDDGNDLTECELDLFENTISCIISSICRICAEKKKTIHIILDMPPSYEQHAERIHNHLFLDVSSPLYEGFEEKKYQIRHYLISAVAPSHINLNIEYIARLCQNINYSNAFSKYIEKGWYQLFLLINDLTGITEISKPNDGIRNVINSIEDAVRSLKDTKKIRDDVVYKILTLGHMEREYAKLLFKALTSNNPSDNALPIGQGEISAILKMLENGGVDA